MPEIIEETRSGSPDSEMVWETVRCYDCGREGRPQDMRTGIRGPHRLAEFVCVDCSE